MTDPLSFGLVSGRPVFMDADDDSYFLLDAKEEAKFADELQRGGADGKAVSPELGWTVEQATPPRITRSFLELCPPSAWRIGDALAIAKLLRRARRLLAREPIAATLAALGKAPPHDDPALLLERLQRFTTARRILPVAPHCLTDSLALLQWLPPSEETLLVFGVKLDPFGAHCWVQRGDLLLNDRDDHIAPFQPVRVVKCASASH